jgi:hypothetical protein
MCIDQYFEESDRRKIKVWAKQLDREGNPVALKVQRPYTVEGLANHLEMHRSTLLNYQKKEGFEEFFATITRAIQRIVDQRVAMGLIGAYDSAMTRFLLMNMAGMREKGETETRTVNINTEPLSAEEAKNIAKQLDDEI